MWKKLSLAGHGQDYHGKKGLEELESEAAACEAVMSGKHLEGREVETPRKTGEPYDAIHEVE